MANQDHTANDQQIRKLGDIVAQIAGPALAIVAVASVAYFLIEITYSGPFVGRVKWIFGLFSFAAVLVSRISIEEGYERANGFGFLLGIATLFVAARFMQGNILGLGLILAFVWWVAGRLTWDCTFLDKTRDASGQGMIDLAVERVNGFLEGKPPSENLDDGFDGQADRYYELTQPMDSAGKPKKPTAWDNFVRIFFRRRQANTPGLWAFYFLLGGLPLFGLGQLFLFMSDGAGQGAAIFHFSTYIISLLGLLMLTSILGLHRHLKNHQSSIPAAIARKWILTGSLLAVGIVGFCYMLPRPSPQFSLAKFIPKFTTQVKDPSKTSMGRDGQKQGSNANANSGPKSRDQKGQKQEPRQGDNSGGNKKKGSTGDPQDKKGAKNSGGKSQGKQGSGGKKKQSSKSAGDRKSGNKDGAQKQSGDKSSGDADRKSGKQKGDGKNSDNNKSDNSSAKKQQGLTPPDRNRKSKQNQKKDRQKGGGNSSSSRQRSSPSKKSDKADNQKSQSDSPQPSSTTEKLAWLLKGIFWMVALAVIAFFGIRHRHQILPWIQSFLAELANMWASLFGRKKKKKVSLGAGPAHEKKRGRKLPAFSSFRDPFLSGAVDSWSSSQLIRYSLEAAEAFARDKGCPRKPEDTAYEFANELAGQFESLRDDARHLASLFAQLAYASGQETGIARQHVLELSGLWNKLSALSAVSTEAPVA